MSRIKDESTPLTPTKKLRFRAELNFQSRVEDLYDEENKKNKDVGSGDGINGKRKTDENNKDKKTEIPSFMDFFKVEMTRGYILEHDEERYTARRRKIYSFMCIPRDLERFMVYGIMRCADSFLYIHTFLPVRILLALWGLLTRPIANCFGLRRRTSRTMTPAEICDLLKGTIWVICTLCMISIDTNRVYHIIKSQSVIKLYIFYNMLEVGDRLLSAFGQDTIDALFWTATESKNAKRDHFGFLPHFVFAFIYVILHSMLIMFQATTLNVAVNSNNKGLLIIMMSNNFVEIKGSVFKKFDKNNLFQLTCCDVRERFHLAVLLFIVTIQTMKEFDWSLSQLYIMVPDVISVLFTEVMIDWIKHAFITRFNELPEIVYREYTTSLAYDMTQTRQKHAFSDHSDLVARRMGFIPFPLGVVLIKAIYSAVSFDNPAAWILFFLAYLFALGLRICLTICALGKACKLMKEHQDERSNSTPSSMTNMPPIGIGVAGAMSANAHNNSTANVSAHFNTIPGTTTLQNSTTRQQNILPQQKRQMDAASSPIHYTNNNDKDANSSVLQSQPSMNQINTNINNASLTTNAATLNSKANIEVNPNDVELDVTNSLELGATALFSNSDVDLDDVCLNENVLDKSTNSNVFVEEELARSEPDLSQQSQKKHTEEDDLVESDCSLQGQSCTSTQIERPRGVPKRTHRRSESEPSLQSITGVTQTESQS